MPRASWRGFLRLSLVSCPIYLSPATTRAKPIRLHQVWPASPAQAKEPGPRPMCAGNPLRNHGQGAIALALVFEPFLAHEDRMGVSAPLAHQARAGLQRSAGVERTNAFLELVRQNPNAALQSAARTAMGAQLQLIGDPPDDQIATEPQRRSGVIKCPPDTPQFLCRLTGQPGDFAIKLS